MQPLIGVTGPDRGGTVSWELTRLALARAGARALRITPDAPAPIDRVDGLVVGGGADIDPTLYGAAVEKVADVIDATRKTVKRRRTVPLSLLFAPGIFVMRKVFQAHTRGPDGKRDVLEKRLIEGALTRRKPLLGICRGAQLLNVCCGGTLYQDVASFYVESPQLRTVLPRKLVHIARASRLAHAIGDAPCVVNALHHQAVRELGDGLAVVAREENGIVQAIELPSERFALGVQWHPEYIPQHRRQRALFEALVSEVTSR
ncbi:MAG: gamma-glutamyl-gamma-aminobutyrate hydrolase family protein [Polyangiales bacterium]